MKTFRYFQPEYVSRFKCTGGDSNCLNNCCNRDWDIDIDAAVYKKYQRIQPKEKAKEITSHFEFKADAEKYFLKERPCPFLTADGLCGIQREYGEEYLSQTCATYPRLTYGIGKFFERSLTLTCPVAAEMILFAEEPLKFEWVEVPDKIHSKHGRIIMRKTKINNVDAELIPEIQTVMISILQERSLSINQRLVVLCFFVDRLEEHFSGKPDIEGFMKLLATYKSEEFLAKQVPLMIESISFDADKFIRLMMEMFEAFYNTKEIRLLNQDRRFMDAVVKTLNIELDANNQISIADITANYNGLAEARKKFLADYSTFLENYLVNELFLNLYPWNHSYDLSKDLSRFLITYKVFELFMFSATQNNLSDKKDLLSLVDWYSNQIDHTSRLKEKIFKYLEGKEDFFEIMESLLER